MKEILLNQAKTIGGGGAAKDFNFEKLEISVDIGGHQEPVEAKSPHFFEFQVNQMLMNSTVQLSLSYSYGENQIIVALYGPSDSRRGQDPSKAIVELTIRDTTTKAEGEGGALGYSLESLRSELKGVLG